jgi:hypothetical protein
MERVKSVEVQKFTSKSSYLVPDEAILLDVLLDVSLDASTASRHRQAFLRSHLAMIFSTGWGMGGNRADAGGEISYLQLSGPPYRLRR